MANVLIIGSGGREHALGWKMAQSPHVDKIFFAPGNGGTDGILGKGQNLPLRAESIEDFAAIASAIKERDITLTLVGPEAPLSLGLVDYLAKQGIHDVFGPTKACAALEADKFFSHQLMSKLDVPCAESYLCTNEEEAIAAIQKLSDKGQMVLKARGLAAGKGVIVCDDAEVAFAALPSLMGSYGADILVSERLYGPEFSVFAICNGEHILPLPLAFQDHKRLLDGDQGPNTGGMGAYGPAPIATAAILTQVTHEVMAPILQHFAQAGTPYRGFLFAGMMLTDDGPKALEFNVRFGDPECQAAMCMLEEDLFVLLRGCIQGKIPLISLTRKAGAACCVVLASQGYPGASTRGLAIHGLQEAAQVEGVEIFHAGTNKRDDHVLTHGGRVLGVTAYAKEGLAQAQARAYEAAAKIQVEGGFHYRKDIAHKALP